MSKHTKEAVSFLLALGEAAGLAFEDGEASITDAVYFFDALRRLSDAVEGSSDIPAEISAWTDTDTAELNELALDFDIPQDKIEAIVKNGIKVAGPLIEFLAQFKHPE